MTKALISKKEQSIHTLKELKDSLQCPFCLESLYFEGQLKCINNHSFDVSKSGYINLSNESDDPHYTKTLFEHRYNIMGIKEFYKPLIDFINKKVKDAELILDAGTGEGSLLDQIESTGLKIGLDLSKQGIQTAAKHYSNPLWMVANLAKIPLKDNTVDLLLSILSPANYLEFKRVMKKDAVFIKVIPGAMYFKEIRMHHESQKHDNSLVLKRFQEEFINYTVKELKYKVDLDIKTRESLLIMSPLAWTMTESQKNDYLECGSNSLSIDLVILIAKT